MIAIALGLVIVSALSMLFVNMSSNNREMAKANKQIENGRFAIQLLENDIVHAGFWGTYMPLWDDLTITGAPTDYPTLVPDPCLAFNATNWTNIHKSNLIGVPVQATSGVPGTCSTTSVIPNKVSATDVVVVRHAATCVPGDANCEADIAGNVYLQASLCEGEILATPVPNTTLYRYILDSTGFGLKKRGCTGTPANTPSSSPPYGTTGTQAVKRKFVSNIYYVRDYSVSPGDGIPTLMRSSFGLASTGGVPAHQAPQALIEGIDGFRVELGIDNLSDANSAVNNEAQITWAPGTTLNSPTNRGNGRPDAYCGTTTACVADDASNNALHGVSLSSLSAQNLARALSNVTVVKVYVLARSLETTSGYTDTKTYALGGTTLGPFNDGYKRHVFSSTIRIANVAGRRETP